MEHKNALGNSSNCCKRVHYADSNKDPEDNLTEGDNHSAISDASKSSAKYTGDINSENSVGTSILDADDQDVRMLKKKLERYEYKMKYLENENKEINANLINERVRASKLEKKLQFVKDNQEVFMRLKEAYINMKYNEAAGRKMIEIREKAIQTWDGIVCSSCSESEELRRQINVMIEKYKELFVVSPGEMEHLINTVKYLKNLIDRREKSWGTNMEREHTLQSHIAALKNDNAGLKELLEKRDLHVKELTQRLMVDGKLERALLDDKKLEEMQKFVEGVTKDMERLKKIIVKYEKRYREIKEKSPSKYITPLNEKESKIVQQIMIKYNAKMPKKSSEGLQQIRSESNDRALTRRPSSPNPVRCRESREESDELNDRGLTRRPSSPNPVRCRASREESDELNDRGLTRRPSSPNPVRCRESREESGLRPKTPERPRSFQSDRRAGSAIMMMDCLFD